MNAKCNNIQRRGQEATKSDILIYLSTESVINVMSDITHIINTNITIPLHMTRNVEGDNDVIHRHSHTVVIHCIPVRVTC